MSDLKIYIESVSCNASLTFQISSLVLLLLSSTCCLVVCPTDNNLTTLALISQSCMMGKLLKLIFGHLVKGMLCIFLYKFYLKVH